MQAVQLAMERRGRERELTSVLLAGLVPAPLTRDQLALGFTRLLASVEVRSTRPTATTTSCQAPVLRARLYPICKLHAMRHAPKGSVGIPLLSHATG